METPLTFENALVWKRPKTDKEQAKEKKLFCFSSAPTSANELKNR